MIELHYAVPAEDVRDIVSVYYFGRATESFSGKEPAAIAQLRFTLAGTCIAEMKGGQRFPVEQSFIQGPTSGPTHYHIDAGAAFIGCGLLPCGWDALVGASAANYVNQIIPVSDRLKVKIDHMDEVLGKADSFEAMIPLMDDMARRLDAAVDKNVRKFVHIVDNWLVASPSPDVAHLYEKLNLSARQIERLVKHFYGAPPKFIARKFRALKAARQLKSAQSDVQDAFYDQSHMIREVKQFTGQTPGALHVDNDELSRLIDSRASFAEQIHPLIALT